MDRFAPSVVGWSPSLKLRHLQLKLRHSKTDGMMSDISLNTAQRQPTVTDTTTTTTPRTNTPANSASTSDSSTTNPSSDSINLSPAAQIGNANFAPGATLSDHDAVNASVGLRQSIGAGSLSVSAKQNQAILSLLR
jgi:hypothetical protein